MSDLRLNKVMGAALATGLVILGLGQVTDILFHAEGPKTPGYAIAIQEEGAGGAAEVELPPDWGTVLPTADVAAGEAVFSKCLSCHNAAPGGPNGTGPGLYDIVGRKPAGHAGFAYSPAMVEYGAKQPAWDYEHLYEYLKSPQGYVKGTKMTFVGLKKQQDRINIVAYLRMQAASPASIPAPNPAAAAAPAAEGAAAAPAEGAAPAADAPTAAAPGAPANAAAATAPAPAAAGPGKTTPGH